MEPKDETYLTPDGHQRCCLIVDYEHTVCGGLPVLSQVTSATALKPAYVGKWTVDCECDNYSGLRDTHEAAWDAWDSAQKATRQGRRVFENPVFSSMLNENDVESGQDPEDEPDEVEKVIAEVVFDQEVGRHHHALTKDINIEGRVQVQIMPIADGKAVVHESLYLDGRIAATGHYDIKAPTGDDPHLTFILSVPTAADAERFSKELSESRVGRAILANVEGGPAHDPLEGTVQFRAPVYGGVVFPAALLKAVRGLASDLGIEITSEDYWG